MGIFFLGRGSNSMYINSELSDNLGLQFTECPHFFTGNLDILTSPSDIVSINERILILTIIGQCDIRHIMTLTLLTIIGQCDIRHIMTLTLLTIIGQCDIRHIMTLTLLTIIGQCDIRHIMTLTLLTIIGQCDIRHIMTLTLLTIIGQCDIRHIMTLTLLTIIGQCDIRHIMTLTLPIKDITSVLKVSTYIITSISNQPRCDTSDNVCLDLESCLYSICLPHPEGKSNVSLYAYFLSRSKVSVFLDFFYTWQGKNLVYFYLPHVKSLEWNGFGNYAPVDFFPPGSSEEKA